MHPPLAAWYGRSLGWIGKPALWPGGFAHPMSRLYINASNVLDKLNTKGGLKTLVFSSNVGGNKRKLYALVCETLKYKATMDEMLSNCNLKKRLMERYRPNFLYVMLYDLIFGKGIEGGGKIKRELKKHEDRLKNELKKIMRNKGAARHSELLPDVLKNAVRMPRYARVNTLKGISSSTVIKHFQEEKSKAAVSTSKRLASAVPVADPHVPYLVVFPPGQDLHDHPLVDSGHLILQDKASCFPAYILARAMGFAKSVKSYQNDGDDFERKLKWSGETGKVDVIDACAAPGNKTSQIASYITKLKNHPKKASSEVDNSVFAFDISPNRLSTLKRRMEEASASNVTPKLQSFLEVDPKDPLYANVKAIMLDPSCSGSGMINRLDHLVDVNKSSKNEHERLTNLAEFQLNALKHAFQFPNVTHVCYSTCSVHDIENENVVAAALKFTRDKQDSKFKLLHSLPEWHRRGHANENLTKDETNCLVRCLGPDDMTNGFFVACFEKQLGELEKQKKVNRNAKRREKRKRNKLKQQKRQADLEKQGLPKKQKR